MKTTNPTPFGRPLTEEEADTVLRNLHMGWPDDTVREASNKAHERRRRHNDRAFMLISGCIVAGACLAAGALGLLGAVILARLTGFLP